MSASVMRMCVIAGQREWTTQTGSSGDSRWILSPECQNSTGNQKHNVGGCCSVGIQMCGLRNLGL